MRSAPPSQACLLFSPLMQIWWIFVSASKTVPSLNSTFGLWFAQPFVLFCNLEHVLTANSGVFLVWLRNSAFCLPLYRIYAKVHLDGTMPGYSRRFMAAHDA